MRVLVATDHWFPDHRGGAARVAAETAGLLAASGHEVDVLCPAADGLPADERDGSLAVHRVLRRSVLPQTLTDPWETRRAARGCTPDVLVAHTCTTAAGLAAARTGAPLVLVFHASALRELRFDRSRLRLGRRRLATYALDRPLALLERRAVERADRIVVLSEFSRSLLEADHPDVLPRTRLAGGGVDTARFTPGDRATARARLGLAPDGELLVTVRRLEPRMGLERLLEAFALLRAERPALRLAIVGRGALRGELERQRARLGLDAAVELVGRVPDEALPDWYRAGDLFVLPTIAYEGFGLVTAEALACGVPVVGTPVGATPELLRPIDERLVAADASAEALAGAVDGGLRLAGPDLARRCREHAVARLSWQAAFPAWRAAITDLHDVRTGQNPVSRGAGSRWTGLRSRA